MIQTIDACQPLAVPTQIMAAIVHVESNGNPYAIGVVNGALRKQPRTLSEAQQTVALLKQQGFNYSIGAAQVNKTNFEAYNINPESSGFDFCSSVKAGAKILAACYVRSYSDWPKAFSCYYSGNFTTGFKQGYVQKVAHAFMQIDREKTKPVVLNKVTESSLEKDKIGINNENRYLTKRVLTQNIRRTTHVLLPKGEESNRFSAEQTFNRPYDNKKDAAKQSSTHSLSNISKSPFEEQLDSMLRINTNSNPLLNSPAINDDSFVF
jgi:hypothetical protein